MNQKKMFKANKETWLLFAREKQKPRIYWETATNKSTCIWRMPLPQNKKKIDNQTQIEFSNLSFDGGHCATPQSQTISSKKARRAKLEKVFSTTLHPPISNNLFQNLQ